MPRSLSSTAGSVASARLTTFPFRPRDDDGVIELARYQDGWWRVVVTRDRDALVFLSSYDDDGQTFATESRVAVDDFVARGEGPWPWYDLGDRRDGALRVLDALRLAYPAYPAWTSPLRPEVLDLFDRARLGSPSLAGLLATGLDPDPLDCCGATPLWYAVRSLSTTSPVALIDAGADPGRRIELSARGEIFTTILHEIVRRGRTGTLRRALSRGADPAAPDSDGATPLHVAGEDSDDPALVRALVAAGAQVDVAMPTGAQPIDTAARRVLPATVAALVELGADPGRGLDAVLSWWVVGSRFAGYRAAEVAAVAEILRAGGAEVTDRHRELAAGVGVEAVRAALR
jgi:uncharacterized protein